MIQDRLFLWVVFVLQYSWFHSGLQLLLQYVLGNSADNFIDQLTIFENHQGWDAADAEFGRYLCILVNVHFSDDGFAFVFASELLHNGANHLTWTAPFGPEID